jgi:aryl-alcohol dehydrogenase-like predicted oxidoreductase
VQYAHFEPAGRPLSRLVLGTSMYKTADPATWPDLLDAWVDAGGNAIDTARHYGNAEGIVGRWLRRRGHDDVTVFTKAGLFDQETGRPRITGGDIAADVEESRAALGLDALPVVFLHRDDPARGVTEIVEELQPLLARGDVGAFGASNWTSARLAEAQRSAAQRGLTGFCCASPNLSLAPPAVEPWPGCVSAHDPAEREWYARAALPVFAWSTLARGWFGQAADEHVDEIFGTPANVERRRRAQLLAADRGVAAAQVALAWVLAQPLRLFAVVGPRTVDELEECIAAVDLRLSDDEARWLDLAAEQRP